MRTSTRRRKYEWVGPSHCSRFAIGLELFISTFPKNSFGFDPGSADRICKRWWYYYKIGEYDDRNHQ